MTTAIQPFSFEGREVRIQADDAGEPWFCAADVCANLGLDNVSMAVAPLDDDEKTKKVQPSIGLRVGVAPSVPQWYVNEPGLYRILTRCDKPKARPFQRWVTHEVLPAIRKTGSYSAAPTALDLRDPAALQRLALELTGLVQEQGKQIADLTPPANAWRELAEAHGDVNLQTAGKALGLPPNLWIAWLRTQGHLFYRGRNLVARQDHLEAGRFVQRVRTQNGEEFIQTLVTPKGIAYWGERRPQLRPVHRAPRPRLPAPPGGVQ